MKKTYWIVGLLLVLQTLIVAPQASANSRMSKKIGLSLGLLTEPYVGAVGYNLSYNLAHFLRLGVGYASLSGTAADPTTGLTADWSLKTIAVDAKGFIFNCNFTPFVNFGFSSLTLTGTPTIGGSSLSFSGSTIYYGGGIDWQTDLGFNLGVEYKTASKGTASLGLPGVYLGWYF